MKKILIAAAAMTALTGAAGAASAQTWQGRHDPHNRYEQRYDQRYGQRYDQRAQINARQRQIAARIEMGVRTGRLTRPETTALRRELQDIRIIEARYARTYGLNWQEAAALNARLDRLDRRVAHELRDNQRYASRSRW